MMLSSCCDGTSGDWETVCLQTRDDRLAGWGRVRNCLSSWRLATITGIMIGLYLFLFPFVAREPEQLHDSFANTWTALLFREVSYIWLVLMVGEGLGMVRRYVQREELLSGHLRFGLLSLAFRCLLAFAAVRILLSFIVYFNPNWPLSHVTLLGSHLMLATCVLFFALAHAPLGWLRTAARLKIYVDQQLALRDLEALRQQLVPLTRPLPWALPTWRESWSQPSYALYCNLIEILDRRSLLLEQVEAGAVHKPMSPAVQNLLGELPNTSDWVELLQHVREIAKGKSQR